MPGAPPSNSPEGNGRHHLGDEIEILLRRGLHQLKRLIIFLIGTTVVLIGVIMFFTPGPAIVVIPVGLGILAIEFAWARLLLKKFQQRATSLGREINQKLHLGTRRTGAPSAPGQGGGEVDQ